jgi:hypothetical protein
MQTVRKISAAILLIAVLVGCGGGGGNDAPVQQTTVSDLTLDQQQLFYDAGLSARTLPGYTVWQSFTAGITGTLEEIDMGFFNDMSGHGQLQILAGEGTGGTVLQVLAVPVVGISQPPVTWNMWTTINVHVTAGQQYTFNFIPDATSLPDPYGVAMGYDAEYSGGTSSIPGFDLVFRTYVRPGS